MPATPAVFIDRDGTLSEELGLDLAASYMIGDKISDVEVGKRVGLTSILVLTGYGLGEWEYRRREWRCTPDHVAADLFDAVQWILARSKP